MAIATAIKGRKGGSSSSRTPTEQPDDLQSVAKAKILLALGEGEFAGGLTARDIYLDGTALENADGSQNFSGVAWEFRSGTQAQKYIQGIPGTENEINVGSEVSSTTAWTRTFTNTQLSAVRLRLKWPSLFKQEDDGDLVGYSVTRVGFNANQFVLMSGSGDTQYSPFAVINGQVFMSSAFIQDGTITNAKIGDFIQSNNYVAGSVGWRLDKSGTFENYGSTAGEGAMKQTNQTISVRDANNVLRVQIGRITGTW